MATRPVVDPDFLEDPDFIPDEGFIPDNPVPTPEPSNYETLKGALKTTWNQYGAPVTDFAMGAAGPMLKDIGTTIWNAPEAIYQGGKFLMNPPLALHKDLPRARESLGKAMEDFQTMMGTGKSTWDAMTHAAGSVPLVGGMAESLLGPIPGYGEELIGEDKTAYQRGKGAGNILKPFTTGAALGFLGGKIMGRYTPQAYQVRYKDFMDQAFRSSGIDLGAGKTLPMGELAHNATMGRVAPYLQDWFDTQGVRVRSPNTQTLVIAAEQMDKKFWNNMDRVVQTPLSEVPINVQALTQDLGASISKLYLDSERANAMATLSKYIPEGTTEITLKDAIRLRAELNAEFQMSFKQQFPTSVMNGPDSSNYIATRGDAFMLHNLGAKLRKTIEDTVSPVMGWEPGTYRNFMQDAHALADFKDKAIRMNQNWGPDRNQVSMQAPAARLEKAAISAIPVVGNRFKSIGHHGGTVMGKSMYRTPDTFVQKAFHQLRNTRFDYPETPTMGTRQLSAAPDESFVRGYTDPSLERPDFLPPAPGLLPEYTPSTMFEESTRLPTSTRSRGKGVNEVQEAPIAISRPPGTPTGMIRKDGELLSSSRKPAPKMKELPPAGSTGSGQGIYEVDPGSAPPPNINPPPGSELNLMSMSGTAPRQVLRATEGNIPGQSDLMGGQVDAFKKLQEIAFRQLMEETKGGTLAGGISFPSRAQILERTYNLIEEFKKFSAGQGGGQ
jgi:hypothetical protein